MYTHFGVTQQFSTLFCLPLFLLTVLQKCHRLLSRPGSGRREEEKRSQRKAQLKKTALANLQKEQIETRKSKEIHKARSEKKTKNCNTVEWFVSRLSYAGAGAAAAVVQVEHLWD